MTTAIATKAFKSVGSLSSFVPLNPYKISTIKKVISFTTDKKSADSTDDLVKFLSKCKETLPTEYNPSLLKQIKHNLNFINKNLLHVNEILQFIDSVFDSNEDVETEIKIDDKNMSKLLCNLKTAKDYMQYISDYLTLVIQVQKAKTDKSKIYSIDEVLNYLKSNAA